MPAALIVLWLVTAGQQAPPARDGQTVGADQLTAAIDRLGAFDDKARTTASRTVRRAAPALAVPALMRAVQQHADQYVRFRALVILSGFNDPRTGDVMARALDDRNDRLRAAAYAYFEQHPDPAILPRLLKALD